MRWQQIARLAIATSVLAFAGIVVFTMRERAAVPEPNEDVRRTAADATFENPDGGSLETARPDGTLAFKLTFKRHLGYRDGRTTFAGVELTLPDRNGRSVTVTAREADVTQTADGLGTADFRGDVRLTTSDGIAMTAGEARYVDREGLVIVPGPLEFSRGRLRGRGVGATYDKNSDVLWLRDRAHVTIAPGEDGSGAADVTAGSIGMVRSENYLRLARDPRVVTDGRIIQADEITVLLRPDGETIQQAQLRGQSRITGDEATAQSMSARDIDLTYAADGRTLEHAHLMNDGVVDLPAGGGKRRIAAQSIDLSLAPDGTTVTTLSATGSVQVDLPGERDVPAKQIRAARLEASGPPGSGIERATFAGGVEYRETRAARGSLAAVDRSVRSAQLVAGTAPGFGSLERAEFQGGVRFTDGATLTAEASRAVYVPGGDRIELTPLEGMAGPPPTVNDGQIVVQARAIQVAPESRKLRAETNVRSTIHPRRQEAGAKEGKGGRLPAMLSGDRPVNVTADRLEYDGVSVATYSGSARLWQDRSQIDADTIVIDDSSGDLTARTGVTTTMLLEDTDPKTKRRTPTKTVGTADTFVYENVKRLAVYTGSDDALARMTGAQGDLTGERIDLYLKEGGKELERAEAHGRVTVVEDRRTASGDRLIYTAATDTYVLTGTPVEVIDREGQTCKKTIAARLKFQRAVDTIQGEGAHGLRLRTETVPCPTERRD
ncbi:MAG TPA: LptA/OstA family protein [Vicinamibacterales bacterium]|nr:LptA/OstA family protein [Vicinamibacterales bacterium]